MTITDLDAAARNLNAAAHLFLVRGRWRLLRRLGVAQRVVRVWTRDSAA
jgi:hypothetical protein